MACVIRYFSSSEDPNSVPIWIDSKLELPNVCCTCGMFTADRVKVKHLATVETSGKAATIWGALHVLLHLFGGPIGWLFALGSFGGSDDEGNKIKKFKIKIPQCVLCRSETKIEVVDSNPAESLYQFYVHPIFAQRYQALAAEAAESD